VWRVCGAVALNSDVVLAAEGARIAGERAAAASAQQEQQSSLSLLRDQALAAETERDQKNLEYGDISAAARAQIIKALFQLEGKAGFSKIKGKNAEVKFLEEYEGDVHDVLAGPLPAAGAAAAAGATAAAGGGDAAGAAGAAASANSATAAAAANGRSIEDIDLAIAEEIKVKQASEARLTALLAERKARSAAERPAA